MAKAKRTFITRRRLMAASAALVPAASIPLPTPSPASESITLTNTSASDPIFAAIEAHARAYTDFDASLIVQSAAERALWQSTEEARAACQARLDALLEAEETLGLAEMEAGEYLVATIPQTLTGALAALRYVRECFECDNYALCDEDGYRRLLYSIECAIQAEIEGAIAWP